MAYDANKFTKVKHLRQLAETIKQKYTTLALYNTLNDRVDNLVNVGGEPNILESVKVNGTALAITNKAVDVLVATGNTNGAVKVNGVDISVKGLAAMAYEADVSEDDLADALKTKINNKADAATTIAGYGITDAYTKAEVNAKVSATYKASGNSEFANLPTPDAGNLGNVYNVTDAFTTDSKFIDGAGKAYPANTNVVVVKDGDAYKYDVLSGFIDLSSYATNSALENKVDKVEGKGLSTNDYSTAEKDKLAGIAENANNYTHPTHDAHGSGMYKVTVDDLGHVTAVTAVAKADITGLGIPSQDTTYNDATPTVHGLMSAADKVKLDGIETATDAEITEMLNEVFPAA